MNNGQISIIVPVYNTEKLLPRCFDSLINQTYDNIEIVVVDDESTDDSMKIINQYADKCHLFSVYSIRHSGLSAARNYGIEKSRGEFVCFVDSDDYVQRDFCEKLVGAIHDVDMAMCGVRIYKNEQYVTSHHVNGIQLYTQQEYLRMLLRSENFCFVVWNKLYRKEILLKNTIMFEKGKRYEDMVYTLQVALNVEKVRVIEDALYNYMRRVGTLSSTIDEQRIKDYQWANERAEDMITQRGIFADRQYREECLKYFHTNLEHIAYVFSLDNDPKHYSIIQSTVNTILSILKKLETSEN